MPTLSRDPVRLRRWGKDDAEVLVQACNDEELHRWLPMPAPYSLEDALAYIALCDHGWETGEQYIFAVVDRMTELIVGSARVGPSPGGATAGYWTAPWARRRGVASAALALVTEWAIAEGLTPVRLYVDPTNAASRSVARCAGFRRDADEILDPEGMVGDLVFAAGRSRKGLEPPP